MAKQAAIEQDGVIVEALSNAMFRVELEKCRGSVSDRSGSLYNPGCRFSLYNADL